VWTDKTKSCAWSLPESSSPSTSDTIPNVHTTRDNWGATIVRFKDRWFLEWRREQQQRLRSPEWSPTCRRSAVLRTRLHGAHQDLRVVDGAPVACQIQSARDRPTNRPSAQTCIRRRRRSPIYLAALTLTVVTVLLMAAAAHNCISWCAFTACLCVNGR